MPFWYPDGAARCDGRAVPVAPIAMPNEPTRSATTSVGSAAAIVRALEARGLDGRAIARDAGIAAPVLGDPDARVPLPALTRLWGLAVAATGDPCLGLAVPRFATPTSLHGLGYAVTASATLGEALERLVRFRRLIGDVIELRLSRTGERHRLEIDLGSPPRVAHEATDAVAAGIVGQVRRLLRDRRFAPLAVALRRPAPADPAAFHRTFGVRVAFGRPANVLELRRTDLARSLPSAHAELARHNDALAARYLARLRTTSMARRVEQALTARLRSGAADKDAVARDLGLSARSLQRRLADEGTTFRDVLQRTRVALAREYVGEGRLSITEIAFLLGFADASGFARAFRRATGSAPTAWAAGARRRRASPR